MKNTFGSNEYRKERHRRRVIAAHNDAVLRRTAAITPAAPALATPPPVATAAAASSSPVDPALLIPTTCLGCGALFQSAFEHEAGYIDAHTVQRYMQALQRRIAPHTNPERHSAPQPEEPHRDSLQNAQGSEQPALAPSDDEVAELVGEDEEHEAASTATADTAWQEALSRGDVSASELEQTRSIHILTPKQAKRQLLKVREEEDAKWAARKAHATYRPPSSSSAAPVLSLPKPLRCVRCYQLTNYGHTRGNVATAISTDFRALLQSRLVEGGAVPAVVLLLVDVLDLHTSVIRGLRELIGRRHRVLIVVNKIDLLPSGYGENRLRAWIKAECDRYGVFYHAVQLVSAKTGEGLQALMRKAAELAGKHEDGPRRDMYLVGAVNTGKSSLLNKLLERGAVDKGEWQSDAALTSSILPGTTLGLVGFPLVPARDGRIYDTPGVTDHPLSSALTVAELKAVLPMRPLVPVTYRLVEGQCILLGGLARIDHVQGRPFFFTAYISQNVTVHLTSAKRMDEPSTAADSVEGVTGMQHLFRLHAGSMLAPPFDYARFTELGLGRGPSLLFDLQGRGWGEAGEDVVFPGVGWVAVTGSGIVRVRASIALSERLQSEEEEERVLPFAREPLMPFDARWSTRAFHGSDTRSRKRTPALQQRRDVDTRVASPALNTQAVGPQLQRHRGLHTRGSLSRSIGWSASVLFSQAARHFSSVPPSPLLPLNAPAVRASRAHSPPASATDPFSSTSSSLSRSAPGAMGRLRWSVYKALLAQQRAAMQHAYIQTEEYLQRPKGSWRVQLDGRLLKRFRQRPNRPLSEEGRFRARMRSRRSRQSHEDEATSSIDSA